MKQKEKRKKNSKKMSFSNSHINAYALNQMCAGAGWLVQSLSNSIRDDFYNSQIW